MTDNVRDPALAGTRTTLAWQRSIVLVAATAASLAKAAITDNQGILGVSVGAGLLIVTGALYLWRGRGEALQPHHDRLRQPALQALTAVTVIAGACSFAVAILIH